VYFVVLIVSLVVTAIAVHCLQRFISKSPVVCQVGCKTLLSTFSVHTLYMVVFAHFSLAGVGTLFQMYIPFLLGHN